MEVISTSSSKIVPTASATAPSLVEANPSTIAILSCDCLLYTSDKGWNAFISGAYPYETRADYPLKGGEKRKVWAVGLAESENLEGPWKRMGEEINPITSIHPQFVENPIVSRLPNGTYIAMFDGGPDYLNLPNRMGYTLSIDGKNWSKARYIAIDTKVKKWWTVMRCV